MEVFPRLYMLETNKECKVSDRWCLENGEWHGNWAWRSNPCGRAAADLVNMLRLVGNLFLSSDSRDQWFWVFHPSEKFLVKDLFHLVESKSIGLGETNQTFIWNYWVPREVNISIWRASMDRLPSRANLLNRDLSSSGKKYEAGGELAQRQVHLFVISLRKVASFENKWVAKCFHGVCYVVLWAIWHWRNRILHAFPLDVDSVRQEDIFPSIQWLYLLWISNRCPHTNRQWCGWVSNPQGAEGV
ncbi:hypothetical protein Tco_1406488 [Tanacetum coccineum]